MSDIVQDIPKQTTAADMVDGTSPSRNQQLLNQRQLSSQRVQQQSNLATKNAAPLPPTVYSKAVSGLSAVFFAFSPVASATLKSFSVYRSPLADSSKATRINTVAVPGDLTKPVYCNDTPPDSSTYYYWVSAVNDAGKESPRAGMGSGAVSASLSQLNIGIVQPFADNAMGINLAHYFLRVEDSSSDSDLHFSAVFGMHSDRHFTYSPPFNDDSKVAVLAYAERGGSSANSILVANFLLEYDNAGTAQALEIDVNNKYADQQLNDTATYTHMTLLNGSTYIPDKVILMGAAGNAPAISRGVVITNMLDRAVQVSGAYSGVVTTDNSGADTIITYRGGDNFNLAWRGGFLWDGVTTGTGSITINETSYPIKQTSPGTGHITINSTTQLTLKGVNLGTHTYGYYYGYPAQALYIDRKGVANTYSGNNVQFNSGKQRFVTSHYSGGGALERVWDIYAHLPVWELLALVHPNRAGE